MACLPPVALDQELEGFGYPSIRLQLHHVIGAEQYWVGVLRGLALQPRRPLQDQRPEPPEGGTLLPSGPAPGLAT